MAGRQVHPPIFKMVQYSRRFPQFLTQVTPIPDLGFPNPQYGLSHKIFLKKVPNSKAKKNMACFR